MEDALSNILQYLTICDLLDWSEVNKKFNELCMDDKLWGKFMEYPYDPLCDRFYVECYDASNYDIIK